MAEERYIELWAAVEAVAAVDAHAHNLVEVDSVFPFLRCFSEAEGDALAAAVHSLSFKRSIRDIASLYGCDSSLHGVESYRKASGLHSTGAQCFAAANLSAVFFDDGIEFDKMHPWEWHSQFVPQVGRILRVESLAEKILTEEMQNGSKITLDSFTGLFVSKLKSVANEIIAMKSIAAYRSGLEINTQVDKKSAEDGLLEDLSARKPIRLQNKNIIDYIFTLSLEIALCFNIPVQIHTGFGDKDLDLRQSNPLLLRGVLEDRRFSACQFVLLHASYPYSKEASYLASVYAQVYLDFGLAVPKLSVQGMISSVKELLELAPINKVMFSSDGYAFPETFYLGAKRARRIIYSVLASACDDGDLTIHEAITGAEGILRNNAISFYNFNKIIRSNDSPRSLVATPIGGKALQKDIAFVRVIWVDNSGQPRCRVIPAKRFYEVVREKGIGLTVASMGMTSYSDGPAEGTGLTGVGEIRLLPDLSTKCTVPWNHNEEMVLGDMQISPGEAWEYCPREVLRRVAKVIKEDYNLVMNAGFELEFYLLRRVVRDGEEKWLPYDATSYCSTSGYDGASSLLREIISSIHSVDISVEQFHAESGNGQFEMALSHTDCISAADSLIYVREIIKAVARKHGLLATFVPKFSLDDIGSGSHVHLSLWENGRNAFMASGPSEGQYGMSKIGEKFMAGVLYHLSSILPIIAPIPNSYDRLQPNTWSGAYHCWGKENREAPLRAACPPGVSKGLVSNFEIKSFDGCANPYLGLAAILAAGVDGLQKNLCLPKPVESDPANYHSELQRLPKDLNESVEALEGNEVMKAFLGEKLMKAILGVRKAEIKYYAENKDAFKQLIHRY